MQQEDQITKEKIAGWLCIIVIFAIAIYGIIHHKIRYENIKIAIREKKILAENLYNKFIFYYSYIRILIISLLFILIIALSNNGTSLENILTYIGSINFLIGALYYASSDSIDGIKLFLDIPKNIVKKIVYKENYDIENQIELLRLEKRKLKKKIS